MPLVGKKIETTNDNFGDRVRKEYLLVDKTLMIKAFWEGQDVSLITRPRRFGKTLNLSMLQHFFAAEVIGESTQGLFDEFTIAKVDNGEFLQKHQGQYPVIFISFKDIKESSYQSAVNQIKVLMQKVYREHKRLLQSDKIDADDKVKFQKYLEASVNNEELQDGLGFLSEFLYKAHGNKKVILLIDEYDSPLTSSYEHKFLNQISDFMRNMLSAALKGNSYLEKGLMTGILRVSKNSMLSGLNNMKVYTLFDTEYSEYFGFTESEMQELIKSTGANQEIDQIKNYYNGYKVGNSVIYNPWSAMQFFDTKKLAPHWVLTSNDKLLKDVLLSSPHETKQQLGDLILEKSIQGEVDVNLRYEDLIEKPTALWTLLLFCGYLTAESAELSATGATQVCQLRIPNQEVKRQYTQVFSEWLKEKIGTTRYDSFLRSLVEGRVEEFTKNLTGYLFSCTSSHDFQAESDYHSFVLGLLISITESHFLFSNKEYGTGRPDCLLIPKDKQKTQGIILEFKHFHFKDKDKHKDIDLLKEASHNSAQKGLEQINVRGYDYAFYQHKHVTSVLKIGIAFSNRIVSSAVVIIEIENGLEKKSLADSQEVKIFDADENEYTKQENLMIQPKQGLRGRRIIIDSDDEEDNLQVFEDGQAGETEKKSNTLASNLQTKKRAREENTANEPEKAEDEKPSASKKQKTKVSSNEKAGAGDQYHSLLFKQSDEDKSKSSEESDVEMSNTNQFKPKA